MPLGALNLEKLSCDKQIHYFYNNLNVGPVVKLFYNDYLPHITYHFNKLNSYLCKQLHWYISGPLQDIFS